MVPFVQEHVLFLTRSDIALDRDDTASLKILHLYWGKRGRQTGPETPDLDCVNNLFFVEILGTVWFCQPARPKSIVSLLRTIKLVYFSLSVASYYVYVRS